tara:strand:+ start:2500 stop:2967 length:468 start_codon:yes stop_codon:yes gene_type:complete
MSEKIHYDFDLLGDPIPANHGKRGRPPHIPTEQNRNKIRLLLAFDWTDTQLAKALRITKATLNKHYFAELRARDEAKPALQANHLQMVYQAAANGNVGAMKELGRQIERHDLAHVLRSQPQKPKEEKLGKKAQARVDARTAHEDTGWAEDLTKVH